MPLNGQTRGMIIREATRRPEDSLTQLERLIAQVGESVSRTNIRYALHKSGFWTANLERKPQQSWKFKA